MPNLPAQIGKGMICLSQGKYSTDEDLSISEEIFKNLGTTLIINERMMPVATAVSGSGPGFYYDKIKDFTQESEWKNYAEVEFIPVLAATAEKEGFPQDQAQLLARVTTGGSFELLRNSGLSPRDLCLRVASPGGTTAEGLSILHNNGSLYDAVEAARRRAEELEKEIRFI
jgi:pyrroline-5-carboxylate reductase